MKIKIENGDKTYLSISFLIVYKILLYFLYSADIPITHILIPNLAIVYAVKFSNHLGLRLIGGLIFKIWGFLDFLRCFKQIFEQRYVPLKLISFIRSNCFVGRVSLLNNPIALALFIKKQQKDD